MKASKLEVFSSLEVSLNSYLYTVLGPLRISSSFIIVLIFFAIISVFFIHYI